MKPGIKAKWVAALRSGEYMQGSGRLRRPDDNSFCCLGVLCNIHAQKHPAVASQERYACQYLGAECYLPDEVVKWAGLVSRIGGRVVIDGCSGTLPMHNDSGKTFAQIADAIEAQL